jgi:hypothetical protein
MQPSACSGSWTVLLIQLSPIGWALRQAGIEIASLHPRLKLKDLSNRFAAVGAVAGIADEAVFRVNFDHILWKPQTIDPVGSSKMLESRKISQRQPPLHQSSRVLVWSRVNAASLKRDLLERYGEPCPEGMRR